MYIVADTIREKYFAPICVETFPDYRVRVLYTRATKIGRFVTGDGRCSRFLRGRVARETENANNFRNAAFRIERNVVSFIDRPTGRPIIVRGASDVSDFGGCYARLSRMFSFRHPGKGLPRLPSARIRNVRNPENDGSGLKVAFYSPSPYSDVYYFQDEFRSYIYSYRFNRPFVGSPPTIIRLNFDNSRPFVFYERAKTNGGRQPN